MRNTIKGTALLTAILTLSLAATAGAHITANSSEAPSDSYATVRFDVGHGCEESPTTQLKIKVPPSVASATPAVHPLWDVTTKEGRKNKVDLHGETITRGVSEVIYTAKKPLPADRLDFFNLSVKLPAGKPGESVPFPTVQKCAKGETRWIQVPAEGEDPDELEDPAPAITLTEAGDDHNAAAEEPEETVELERAGASIDGEDGAPVWLVIVALVLGGLGLAAGVGSLARSRRPAG